MTTSKPEESALIIHLFGPFSAQVNGSPLPRLRSRRGQSLLALLLLRQGQQVERSWVAGVLWPESDESQALANLRQSLTDLRKALGTEAGRLRAPTSHTLHFDPVGASVDTVRFDAAIALGDDSSLEQAVALYRGPLMEGCDEEWLGTERQRREQERLSALETLADHALAARASEKAIRYLRELVACDPLRESAQRALMQALADAGDHAAVTQVYRDFRLYLHSELNISPDAETIALYQALKSARNKPVQMRAEPQPGSVVKASLRSLPCPLTRLLGRKEEREHIAAALNTARLVTLTGPGGVGKTRLAIAVAEELADSYAEGSFFVDLATLSDSALVPAAVASVLNLREEPGQALLTTLSAFLEHQELLLVLDNCEHLIAACAHLAESLLRGCSGLRLLATSRQALGLTGEAVWPVPTLSLPVFPFPASAANETMSERLSRLTAYEAIQLFVERAQQALPGFQISGQNASSIARICVDLDGMPLAIELAAARVKAMTVEQIAARLKDRFALLTGGSRTVVLRQQTLRATLDWSYDLLTTQERLLLGRLCVFAGGWSLEAAEHVCAGQSIRERDTLDLLSSLVDKTLVEFGEDSQGEGRYRLLETVRQYGREKLKEAGEAESERLENRHLDYFLLLAERTRPHLQGPEQTVWIDRLVIEYDNLRAALKQSSECETRLRLANALYIFWYVRNHYEEGRSWLESGLALCAADAAEPASQPSASLASLKTQAHNGAGILAWYQGDLAGAEAHYQISLQLARQRGDRPGEAKILSNLGLLARDREDFSTARDRYEQSIVIHRALGDAAPLAMALNNLGALELALGDFTTARTLLEECLALQRALGDVRSIAMALCNLGEVITRQGDYVTAQRHFCDSLRMRNELGDRYGTAVALEGFVFLAQMQGNPERSAFLLGGIELLFKALGERPSLVRKKEYAELENRLRSELGDEAFFAEWSKGHAMECEPLVQNVLKQYSL